MFWLSSICYLCFVIHYKHKILFVITIEIKILFLFLYNFHDCYLFEIFFICTFIKFTRGPCFIFVQFFTNVPKTLEQDIFHQFFNRVYCFINIEQYIYYYGYVMFITCLYNLNVLRMTSSVTLFILFTLITKLVNQNKATCHQAT